MEVERPASDIPQVKNSLIEAKDNEVNCQTSSEF